MHIDPHYFHHSRGNQSILCQKAIVRAVQFMLKHYQAVLKTFFRFCQIESLIPPCHFSLLAFLHFLVLKHQFSNSVLRVCLGTLPLFVVYDLQAQKFFEWKHFLILQEFLFSSFRGPFQAFQGILPVCHNPRPCYMNHHQVNNILLIMTLFLLWWGVFLH